MGVTSNYSFPVPVATDLVKDGWDAINDLGVAVDTAMNTALGTKKSGLVLLNTTSFSAVASQSINSVFSATYDFYRIVLQAKPTAGNNITFRFRAAGVDNSGATSYRSQQGVFGGTSASAKRNDTSAFNLNYDNNTPEWKNLAFDIVRPFSTDVDKFIFGFGYGENGIIFSGGQLTSSTQFDGFTIIANTSTITGKIQVYGYNQ